MNKRVYFLGAAILSFLLFCKPLWAKDGDMTITSPIDNDQVSNNVTFQGNWVIPPDFEGPASLEVTAYDKAGNKINERRIGLIVKKPYTAAPLSIDLLSPRDGDTVKGTVTVRAKAAGGPDGLDRVEFEHGGTPPSHIVRSEPYEVEWDTTTNDNGKLAFNALAYDKSGKRVYKQVFVTIDN